MPSSFHLASKQSCPFWHDRNHNVASTLFKVVLFYNDLMEDATRLYANVDTYPCLNFFHQHRRNNLHISFTSIEEMMNFKDPKPYLKPNRKPH